MRQVAARIPPWAVAAALALAWLVLEPQTGDLPAQEYRATLFGRAPWAIWDNGWYAGHALPAYSLLFPPLGSLVGPRLLGALAAVAGTWAFSRLAGQAARLAGAWCALGMVSVLVAGRLTFALGAALGLGALAAARGAGRRCGVGAVGLAALCSAGSPIAGAFLALAAAASWIGDPRARRARTLGLGIASVLPAGLAAALFPEGGTFPFAFTSFAPALAATLLVLLLLPRRSRVLRAGTFLSAVGLVVSWALLTPMGGNAVRLGSLLAGPVLVAALRGTGRGRPLALLAPALLYWQLVAPVGAWLRTADDPTVHPGSFVALKRFLAAQGGSPFRVEVPFTANHWEAAYLAGGHDSVPLARGWERQYDRKVNGLFYDGRPVTAGRYRAWLDANAVRFVAVPDAPLDPSAAAEARLVRAGLRGLRQVYRDRVWTVWEVAHAAPMGVSRLTPDGFSTTHAGIVRIRWTPYFTVIAGRGCITRTRDGHLAAGGAVTVRARLSLRGLQRPVRACSRGS